MLEDSEFRTRLRLLAESGSVFERWGVVIHELIKTYYPWVSLRQEKVLCCIIYVIWDIGFNSALYVEVSSRLTLTEKRLFPTNNSVRQTIKKLCKKGVTTSKIDTFESYDSSGTTLLRSSRHRVLDVSDKFRIKLLLQWEK